MRKLLALVVTGLLVAPASATIYNDATGDLHDGTGGGANFSGFTHLDIASLEITDDGASTINFTFTLVGDPTATDWGKYCLIFDTVPGGDLFGNGWGRPFGMPSGADKWIGSWVDSGNGAQVWSWDGAAWVMDGQSPSLITVPTKNSSQVMFSTTLAALGLSPGDSFAFDAISTASGDGDGAVDSLGNPFPQITDWGQTSTAVPQTYTVTPEPAALALLAIGGAALLRRRS
jgi:MYXO-CTERM domain-containing protein